MPSDILPVSVIRAMAQGLSLLDLIRAAETFKSSGQDGSAETLYAGWIHLNGTHPHLYAALFNYSVLLSDCGKLDEAKQCLDRAITLNPDFMPAYINLGRICERQGGVGSAIVQWSVVLKKLEVVNGTAITHKTTALNQIARTLEAAGQDEAAEDMLRQSLELDPRQREVIQHLLALRQRQCEWPVVSPGERFTAETLMTGMSPLSAAAHTDDPMLQLALAAHYNRMDVGRPVNAMTAWPQAMAASGRLRVGYLSSDLREHAVGYLMEDVFALHDRDKVEVFAYYCGIDAADRMHERFKASADHWTRLSADDTVAAGQIAQDGIQILVDLNGYTRDARLKLVAQRPAPVIVNWLGYPGTMASPYHHYIVADDWIIPDELALYYSEQVVRLPCYQPTPLNRTVSARCPSRTEAGLPEDATVFCSFNGAHKLTRFTFDRWLMILASVPGSVLWLLAAGEATRERLWKHAEQRGIGRDRIHFADRQPNPDHLARYPLADLFLDTTPYGAHTTASDALWMGVPVLTLSGRSFASRVCGSLVRAAGLPELVCTTPEDYVSRAIALGNDRDALRLLREKLLAQHSSCRLFDTAGLVRHLEAAFIEMWRHGQEGTLPRPDLANLDVYLEVGAQIDHEEIDVQGIADYAGWWRGILAPCHRFRPIAPDHRLLPDPQVLSAAG